MATNGAPAASDDRGSFVRFALVGGASSLIYSMIVAAVISLTDWNVFLSGLVIFCMFIPVTFYVHKVVTFRAQNIKGGAFGKYAALQVACFALISYVGARHVSDVYWLDTLVYFITVTLAAVLSFVVGRLFVFFIVPAMYGYVSCLCLGIKWLYGVM